MNINDFKLIVIDGKSFIWRGGDLHTHKGVLKEKDIIKGGLINTHKGIKAFVFPLTIPDFVEHLRRGPAIINPKDFGLIVGLTGINKQSIVVEAGTGSGAMTIMLASIVKKVYSYEKRKDFFEIAKKNIALTNLNNIVLKNKDFSLVEEKNVDLIFLDLLNPEQFIDTAYSSLKQGGFLVTYTPQISQAMDVVRNAKNFFLVDVVQPLSIHWVLNNKIVRPRHIQRVHTGFLTFLRKV